MKRSFLERLLTRSDKMITDEIKSYLIRIDREKGFFEKIFNTLQEGVLVLNAQAKIEYINRAACRLFSIPDEHQSPPISKYLKGIQWESLLKENRAINRNLEIYYPEHRMLQMNLIPLGLDNVGQDLFVIIFHDITKQMESTKEAVESERIKTLTLLAAGVAHELGNPINNLNIHLQLIERDLRSLPESSTKYIRESLEIAHKELARLDTIIDQFLRAIRPTDPNRSLNDLDSLVAETINLLKTELKDRDVLVETTCTPTLPRLMLDADQMKQAFYNLVRNAMQAMNKGGILKISTGSQGEFAAIAFEDNGPGIPTDALPHITEPYFTTKEKGNGLGLMIVQRIVSEHGGMLEINSAEGVGTTVRILLPIRSKTIHLLPE